MKRFIPFLLAIILLAVVFYAGFAAKKNNSTNTTNESNATSTYSAADLTAYHDDTYGFSFDYPKDFKVKVENGDPNYKSIVRNIFVDAPANTLENIGFRVVKGRMPVANGNCIQKTEVIGKDNISVLRLACGDAGEHGISYYIPLKKAGYYLVFYYGWSSTDLSLPSIMDAINAVKGSIQVQQ